MRLQEAPEVAVRAFVAADRVTAVPAHVRRVVEDLRDPDIEVFQRLEAKNRRIRGGRRERLRKRRRSGEGRSRRRSRPGREEHKRKGVGMRYSPMSGPDRVRGTRRRSRGAGARRDRSPGYGFWMPCRYAWRG